MSDAQLNYENTKRTTPIPTGWKLVEPSDCNPTADVVNFWDPIDQCWLQLKITAEGAPEAFNKLWTGGSTCLVVKDPNYVAPPPAPTFGGMSNLPFAAPTPFAIPALVAAPTIPVAPTHYVAPITLNPVPAIPAPIQIPVAMPAPIAIPIAAPAMLPMPTAPVIPTFTPAPSLPQIPSFPVAQIEKEEVTPESEAPFSAADPNEVSAWLAAHEGVKAQIDALEKVEKELRKRIVKTCFPDGLREGANKCSLPDGGEVVITGVVNRSIDESQVPTALQALQAKNGVAPTGLFKTKYGIDLRVFRGLSAEDKALLADCVTEKEGLPQLTVKAPK